MPLGRAFDSPEAKRRYVRRLFATIAPRYDFITRFLSFGRDQHWKRRVIVLAGVRRGHRVLDLACGTGDLTLAAASIGAQTVGLDLTPGMLSAAQKRDRTARARWIAGDMTQLPLDSSRFDVVTTGYGLRNVPDLPRALAEIYRVLRPGGTLVSLDFNRPEHSLVRAIYLAYLTVVGSALGWVLHRDPDTYRYIPASIRRYPGAPGVAGMLRQTGFVDVQYVRVLGPFMAIHVARRG
jgi:demethylmenaquinone methyltransferase/2-methoxy-6-polyprenyl-1,4-benzoquinol methylase